MNTEVLIYFSNYFLIIFSFSIYFYPNFSQFISIQLIQIVIGKCYQIKSCNDVMFVQHLNMLSNEQILRRSNLIF